MDIAALEAGYPNKRRQRIRPVAERMDENTIPEPNSGCFLWIGHYNSVGYGRLNVRGKGWLAHRIAWALANGPIPEGRLVLHKCDNKPCVNPRHLYLGDYHDNGNDCADRMRHPFVRKTHCSRGHLLSGPNLKRRSQSTTGRQRRECIACMKVSRLKWYHKHRPSL